MNESHYIDNPRNAASLPDVITNWSDPESVKAFLERRRNHDARVAEDEALEHMRLDFEANGTRDPRQPY